MAIIRFERFLPSGRAQFGGKPSAVEPARKALQEAGIQAKVQSQREGGAWVEAADQDVDRVKQALAAKGIQVLASKTAFHPDPYVQAARQRMVKDLGPIKYTGSAKKALDEMSQPHPGAVCGECGRTVTNGEYSQGMSTCCKYDVCAQEEYETYPRKSDDVNPAGMPHAPETPRPELMIRRRSGLGGLRIAEEESEKSTARMDEGRPYLDAVRTPEPPPSKRMDEDQPYLEAVQEPGQSIHTSDVEAETIDWNGKTWEIEWPEPGTVRLVAWKPLGKSGLDVKGRWIDDICEMPESYFDEISNGEQDPEQAANDNAALSVPSEGQVGPSIPSGSDAAHRHIGVNDKTSTVQPDPEIMARQPQEPGQDGRPFICTRCGQDVSEGAEGFIDREGLPVHAKCGQPGELQEYKDANNGQGYRLNAQYFPAWQEFYQQQDSKQTKVPAPPEKRKPAPEGEVYVDELLPKHSADVETKESATAVDSPSDEVSEKPTPHNPDWFQEFLPDMTKMGFKPEPKDTSHDGLITSFTAPKSDLAKTLKQYFAAKGFRNTDGRTYMAHTGNPHVNLDGPNGATVQISWHPKGGPLGLSFLSMRWSGAPKDSSEKQADAPTGDKTSVVHTDDRSLVEDFEDKADSYSGGGNPNPSSADDICLVLWQDSRSFLNVKNRNGWVVLKDLNSATEENIDPDIFKQLLDQKLIRHYSKNNYQLSEAGRTRGEEVAAEIESKEGSTKTADGIQNELAQSGVAIDGAMITMDNSAPAEAKNPQPIKSLASLTYTAGLTLKMLRKLPKN